MTILLLQFIYCLEVPVQVLARIAPRVSGIMDLLVSPGVRKKNLASVRLQIRKCVKDVSAEVDKASSTRSMSSNARQVSDWYN
jgi:hypothetical protein